MNKQVFRNDYFIIVYTNIQGVFEDFDLYIIDQQTKKRKYYSSFYSLQEVIFSMSNIYNIIKEVEQYA